MERQIKRIVLYVAVCVSSCALYAEIDYGSRVNGDEPRLYVDRYADFRRGYDFACRMPCRFSILHPFPSRKTMVCATAKE
jgi:hypothetical protein